MLIAGCTLTMVLVTDWLLTVAGIGDSKAVMDLGAQFLEVSPEHRVQHHLAEQERLKRAGSYLAPIRYNQALLHSFCCWSCSLYILLSYGRVACGWPCVFSVGANLLHLIHANAARCTETPP